MAFVSNFSGEKVSFNLFQVIFHINFFLVDSMTIICFKFWNFTMKLFHILGLTKELVFGSSTSVPRLNLLFYAF